MLFGATFSLFPCGVGHAIRCSWRRLPLSVAEAMKFPPHWFVKRSAVQHSLPLTIENTTTILGEVSLLNDLHHQAFSKRTT
jgi:hypothetical protein